MKTTWLLGAALCAMLTTPCPAQPAAETAPTKAGWGFDVAGMDRAVRPGDDFFGFVNGAWARAAVIPPDRSSYGVFDAVQVRTDGRFAEIIAAELAKPEGSRVANLYRSYLDEAGVEAKGVAPVADELAAIAAAPDRGALAGVMGRLQAEDVDGLVDAYPAPDPQDTRRYVLRLEQSGLELPAREDYLGVGPEAAHVRSAYRGYLAHMLTAVGAPDPGPRADAVLAFEIRLAQAHWTDADRREDAKTDNPTTLAALQAQAPGLDWAGYLRALEVPASAPLVADEPSAFAAEAGLWAQTSTPVLKDWLTLALLKRYAPYLPHRFADLRFGFFRGVLGGAKTQPSRQVSGGRLASSELRDDIGRAYAARYFPAEDKAAVEKIVDQIKAAYRRRLSEASWLSPETRRLAVAKLDNAQVLVGYPETWRDYTSLVIRPDDLVGNVRRAERFEHQRQLVKLGAPVNRREWVLPVTATGAVANPDLVSIGFPAGMLQAPIYDRAADPAVNFGAVGAIVGHELSHLFDDQGRRHDVNGRLRTWWSAQDVQGYTARADRLVAQYDAYEPLPGLHLNGRVELGENLADLLGLQVALDGYHLSLGGAAPAVVDGFTGDERFFLGFGQLQRSVVRPEQLRAQVVGDVHAPADDRVKQVRNLDAWYAAFGVRPGDKLYLEPSERVKVW